MIEVNTSEIDSIASAINAYELPIIPAVALIEAKIILTKIPIKVVLIPLLAFPEIFLSIVYFVLLVRLIIH